VNNEKIATATPASEPTGTPEGNSSLSTIHLSLLKKYWGYDDFRGIQREIIDSIMAGRDTLGLMPTGGGKSITFQVPALAKEGVCIVITPLIALMKDQVQNLRRRGIKSAAIYSGMEHEHILTTLENAVFGAVKILYVSPERLSSSLFRTKLRHMQVSFITVDEAHCISQWGYDFRPSYLEIAEIRRELPGIPILALTATATPTVVQDIQDKLAPPADSSVPLQKTASASGFNVFRMSFERSNLAYVVRQAADKYDELLHILNNVEGTAIVYVRSRRRTKEISDILNEHLKATKPGVQASTFYHAGLDTIVKDERQKAWQDDKVRVMVATNAFGMGIDKPDVRLVVHVDCPDSIEAYFQEAGRAGRDGQKAYAVLLYNSNDQRKLLKRISDTFPEKDYIRKVYDHLAFYYQVATGAGYNATFEFNVDDFCQKFRHFPVQVHSALKILNRASYIEYIEEQESQARVMFCLSRDQLYRLEQTDPVEERIITTLLRQYGGLFVDYCYIDEALIAHETELTKPQVYMTLKNLAQKHIIRFIPQKRTPYVRYMQRREDSEHLMFTAEVYDSLRQRYADRIQAMLAYIQTNNQCRSRQLLRYFGEENDHDCGQCDVCLSYAHTHTNPAQSGQAQQHILTLLADHKRHHVTQLRQLPLPYEQIEAALEDLLLEEQVYLEDGYLTLAQGQ
jgi:ATP-dependent DNA helicase RecQ